MSVSPRTADLGVIKPLRLYDDCFHRRIDFGAICDGHLSLAHCRQVKTAFGGAQFNFMLRSFTRALVFGK